MIVVALFDGADPVDANFLAIPGIGSVTRCSPPDQFRLQISFNEVADDVGLSPALTLLQNYIAYDP